MAPEKLMQFKLLNQRLGSRLMIGVSKSGKRLEVEILGFRRVKNEFAINRGPRVFLS